MGENFCSWRKGPKFHSSRAASCLILLMREGARDKDHNDYDKDDKDEDNEDERADEFQYHR